MMPSATIWRSMNSPFASRDRFPSLPSPRSAMVLSPNVARDAIAKANPMHAKPMKHRQKHLDRAPDLTGATAYSLASCLIGLGQIGRSNLDSCSKSTCRAVAQLAGDPDWGADVALAQAEIAYRRGNYDAARGYVQSVGPVFTRKTAEPYQKRAFESLKAALDKVPLRN